ADERHQIIGEQSLCTRLGMDRDIGQGGDLRDQVLAQAARLSRLSSKARVIERAAKSGGFLEEDDFAARLTRLNGGGKPRRSSANDQDIGKGIGLVVIAMVG